MRALFVFFIQASHPERSGGKKTKGERIKRY